MIGNYTDFRTGSKLVVSKNALTHYFLWILNKHIKPSDVNNALLVLKRFKQLAQRDETITQDLLRLIDTYRVNLEATENVLLKLYGIEAFILIQNPLDR